MNTSSTRNCKFCGKEFSTTYVGKKGWAYTIDTNHCSKSCASKARGRIGCILPDVGAEVLTSKAHSYVKRSGRYCTLTEIAKEIGHSNKTLMKHGLTAQKLNADIGYVRQTSTFQKKVEEVLRETYGEVEVEKSFDGLVGTTGYPLRVDFYIPSLGLVVEADGAQHSTEDHPWAKSAASTVRERDGIKNKYFEEHGIPIKRIPYKRTFDSNYVLSKLE